MSYVLIDGKRYYKDDRTGRTTLDKVSQAEADRRALRNQEMARNSGMSSSSAAAGNGSRRRAANPINTTRTVSTTVHTGFP